MVKNENIGKPWYASKTVWANIISLFGIFSAKYAGVEIGPEEAAAILTVINLILRVVTKEPIRFK